MWAPLLHLIYSYFGRDRLLIARVMQILVIRWKIEIRSLTDVLSTEDFYGYAQCVR
jgi:hypothetical protein